MQKEKERLLKILDVGVVDKKGKHKRIKYLYINQKVLEKRLAKIAYLLVWIFAILCAYMLGLFNYTVF